jgi:hypothetical protein
MGRRKDSPVLPADPVAHHASIPPMLCPLISQKQRRAVLLL